MVHRALLSPCYTLHLRVQQMSRVSEQPPPANYGEHSFHAVGYIRSICLPAHPSKPYRDAATKRREKAASSPSPLLPDRRSKHRGRSHLSVWQRRLLGSWL